MLIDLMLLSNNVGKVNVSEVDVGVYSVDLICDKAGKYLIDIVVNDVPRAQHSVVCAGDSEGKLKTRITHSVHCSAPSIGEVLR